MENICNNPNINLFTDIFYHNYIGADYHKKVMDSILEDSFVTLDLQ